MNENKLVNKHYTNLRKKGSSTHNLEHWVKKDGKWRHYATPVQNKPYAICKAEKTKLEANKKHYEFYKIVNN